MRALHGVVVAAVVLSGCESLSLSSSSTFHGSPLQECVTTMTSRSRGDLQMRKQKASDRRTRRQQRGDIDSELSISTTTTSPMHGNNWRYKQIMLSAAKEKMVGRGRSRKRSALYNSLSLYHNRFLSLLTKEYQEEEDEVLNRIKASLDDPLGYEAAGFGLLDLFVERRGNLFSDEVYRLTKARDSTTKYPPSASVLASTSENDDSSSKSSIGSTLSSDRFLPPNHKFSTNDVILLTLQPQGSGDFFDPYSLPTSDSAVSVEARVLNTGPTYVDVALQGGAFEAAFGPAPNNSGPSGRGDPKMRLRADRFFSSVPYSRMVAALSQLTTIPENKPQQSKSDETADGNASNLYDNISIDELLRQTILSTHAYSDPLSAYYEDKDICDLHYLSTSLAKPPTAASNKFAKKALAYIQANPHSVFNEFNGPQLAATNAALTRRLTLIQGPPGTGKTTVASAIAFGFVYQCRALSPQTKVLATAFSNVGADNLAEGLLRLGLKVVRIGKPSAVSESLLEHTLDAHIDRDPDAQKALEKAATATAQLRKLQKYDYSGNGSKSSSGISSQVARELATAAVKASVKAANIAATKAFREADVIVSTSTGASDPRLLAACGMVTEDDHGLDANGRERSARKPTVTFERSAAPDGLPPLSLPFVLIDEACQSVEPASLVPIMSTNSCRSLVLLGDPCQLPPTVRATDDGDDSPLSVSLMQRLAKVLPHPIFPERGNKEVRDTRYLDSLPVKHARSLFQSTGNRDMQQSYRKICSGSMLLSIQYRMHPSISAFPSAIFYDGLLATPGALAGTRQFPKVLRDSMPCADKSQCVRVVNVGGRNNERRGALKAGLGSQSAMFASSEQNSFWNEPEAYKALSIVKEVVLAEKNDLSLPQRIGIVTPYRGQVQLIKQMIAEDEELSSALRNSTTTLEVKTVDGYQGRERDMIIFSAVRSNRNSGIGFLRDWRRLNVGLTRAREALIVVGDLDTLADGDRHWAAFKKWADDASCVIDDSYDPYEEESC